MLIVGKVYNSTLRLTISLNTIIGQVNYKETWFRSLSFYINYTELKHFCSKLFNYPIWIIFQLFNLESWNPLSTQSAILKEVLLIINYRYEMLYCMFCIFFYTDACPALGHMLLMNQILKLESVSDKKILDTSLVHLQNISGLKLKKKLKWFNWIKLFSLEVCKKIDYYGQNLVG